MRGLTRHPDSGIWYVNKRAYGRTIRRSTGSRDRAEAERLLAKWIEDARQTALYGRLPRKTFEDVAAEYIRDIAVRDFYRADRGISLVLPYIGHMDISSISFRDIEPYVRDRLAGGICAATINRDLAPVKRVFSWACERGYLHHVPKLPNLTIKRRTPRCITFEEQTRLIQELPEELARMTLFALNTGARRGEILNLRKEWKVRGLPAFVIPEGFHKGSGERTIILNSTATASLKSGFRRKTFYGRQWQSCCIKAGISRLRVHDLRHTYATRLRAAGISEEDRNALMGHKSAKMAQYYAQPDIRRLAELAERIVEMREEPVLQVVGRGR